MFDLKYLVLARAMCHPSDFTGRTGDSPCSLTLGLGFQILWCKISASGYLPMLLTDSVRSKSNSNMIREFQVPKIHSQMFCFLSCVLTIASKKVRSWENAKSDQRDPKAKTGHCILNVSCTCMRIFIHLWCAVSFWKTTNLYYWLFWILITSDNEKIYHMDEGL